MELDGIKEFYENQQIDVYNVTLNLLAIVIICKYFNAYNVIQHKYINNP